MFFMPEKGGGLSWSKLLRQIERDAYSSTLPYISYDPDTGVYVNQDNTIGFLWECLPLAFAGMKTVNVLEGLFRAGLPEGSVLQFILYADPHIEPVLELYEQCRVRNEPMVAGFAAGQTNYLRALTKASEKMANIPVRNFRLLVAAKLPMESREAQGDMWSDIQRQLQETLAGAQLAPRPMPPEDLLEMMRRFFNSSHCANIRNWDEDMPLRKQMIFAETAIDDLDRSMLIGDRHFRCMTPNSIAKEVNPLQTNELFGGVMGLIADSSQIQTPFLCSVNVVFCNQALRGKLHAKCNLVLQQQAFGSYAPSLKRRQEEYLVATDDLERGVQFVRVMPTLWVWDEDPAKAVDAITRARRIWDSNGYVMQEDRSVLKILLCASLPFGLYATQANLDNLVRDFIADVPAVVPTLPVQADFAGAGKVPKMLFIGRKGQVAGLDLFDRDAPNHNCLLLGSSGSGKSFFINNMAFSYYSTGSLVRIIDIGRSYLKLANMIPGARFLDFTPTADISLNPFTFIQEPDEELKSVSAVITQMAFANSPNQAPTDIQIQLVNDAVRYAWKREGSEACVDTVHAFLEAYPNLGSEVGLNGVAKTRDIIDMAHTLAYQLKEFTREGTYSKFFAGPSTFDIRNDEFVVLELESLKPIPALYRVITLQVVNAVTQDLYLSDRSRARLCIFDESWQFLSASGGGGGQMLSPVIAEGYRRARKYNGSFTVVSQSLLDIPKFGEVGEIINGNSAFKIFLESSDMTRARSLGLIDYDDFTIRMLQSIKSKRPKYSELFLDSPFGRGCLRLSVDDYTYYVCTSDAKEYAQIEQLVAQGNSYDQAIRIMAAERAKRA